MSKLKSIVASAMNTKINKKASNLLVDNFGIGYLLKNSIIEDADLKVIEFDNLPKEDVYIYYINDLLSKASKEFLDNLIN